MERPKQEVPAVPPAGTIRRAGAEPIPGYRLIEPVGQGGFGEVWKCEVPGGLIKAIKFVNGTERSGSAAAQELQALERVKALRHPFIISLDRVEVVDGVLVIVMELADSSLLTIQSECQEEGLPGIPREELLGYLLEAAEALDWMSTEHGLQHLDVKPHNLFVVSNHVKVADFGLVDRLQEPGDTPQPRRGGVTPLYASPELLSGTLSPQCDQYSLAIVYQQLLTGTVPFWSASPHELADLHRNAEPNLTTLPHADRPVVARALAKVPEQRFPSCLDFVRALACGAAPAGGRPRPVARRRPPTGPTVVDEKPTKQVRRPAALQTSRPDAPRSEPAPPGTSQPPTPHEGPAVTTSPGHKASSETMLDPGPGPKGAGPSAPASQPTSVCLPGYRFDRCLSRSPLGDVWNVRGPDGRDRRAFCLSSCVGQDEQLLSRLRALRHPELPPAEVSCSPEGRLVVITDHFDRTLRDRLEECQGQGLQGIPRVELLGHLRSAAEALDAVWRREGLQHLGLNPRNLLIDGQRLWVADFGLVPLAWLPSGQSAGQLNCRYAAPELFEGQPSAASDQYSLALIYAEMLTGFFPRPRRAASGLHRRLGAEAGPREAGPRRTRGPTRIDLDLLPATDRDVVARALHGDPARRFESCAALVQALEDASNAAAALEHTYRCLPPVIPYASLLGAPAPPDVVLPPVRQVVLDLLTPPLSAEEAEAAGDPSGARLVGGLRRALLPVPGARGPWNILSAVHPDGSWEYKCPIRVLPGALRLKVNGFCQQWNARLLREEGDLFVFLLDLQPPRFSEPSPRPVPQLEIQVQLQPPRGPDTRLSEVRVRLKPVGAEPGPRNGEEAACQLDKMGLQVFESIRSCLQAAPEQRSKERWPCPHRLRVYPVLPDLELATVLEAVGRNISWGGVCFRTRQPPPAEQVYLHWHESPQVCAYAVLARVVWLRPAGSDGYEVGASFPERAPEEPTA